MVKGACEASLTSTDDNGLNPGLKSKVRALGGKRLSRNVALPLQVLISTVFEQQKGLDPQQYINAHP